MLLTEDMVVAERFKLSKMIGRGGMGSVWQAADLRLNTTCAVKFIEGEMAHLAEAHSRFQREAQAAAQLRSPHVVQIFDHGVWQDHPYIAMELLDGEDLGKRITAHGGRLPAAAVNIVVQQVCRALSKAHAAGVVHRDLKPDNIFLVTDDDREIVKILDFGVAKSAGQALDGSNTKTGAMLGTPYYMSPEQAQGIKSVDSRSDLWSLAVIVFQCLTGRLPFESEALGDLLVKIIVNPIPVPSAFNAALPPSFDAWWIKAADRNTDNRFQTAKLFAESLAVALGEAAAPASDPHLARPVGSGTAIMASAANTPMPGSQSHPQAMAPRGTPNPAQPYGAGQPIMHAPEQPSSYGGAATSATGNLISGTFPGIEPLASSPKKATPVALIVGLSLVLLVGLGLGGAAFIARGRVAQGASLASSGGAASTATATAEPTAVASASVEPRVEPSALAEPVPPAAASAGSGAPSAVAATAGAHRAPTAVPTPTGKLVAKPGAAATPPPSAAKKPLDLGF